MAQYLLTITTVKSRGYYKNRYEERIIMTMELIDRNAKIVAEVQELKEMDVKRPERKIGDKYGLTERRIWDIKYQVKMKELLEKEKNA